MGHVIAFDVSMGKSTMVVYDHNQHCQYEGEVEHTATGFQWLKKKIHSLRGQDDQPPEIVFEATGAYSEGLESFLKEQGYPYYRINPLQAKIQTAAMRRQKTDIGDAHQLAKSQFKSERYETYVQDEYFEQMRALGRYHDDLEKEIRNYSNRLHAFLQLSFPYWKRYSRRVQTNSCMLYSFFRIPTTYIHAQKKKSAI